MKVIGTVAVSLSKSIAYRAHPDGRVHALAQLPL